MGKRIVEVKFIGVPPFVLPLITYEDGTKQFLTLSTVGGRGKANTMQSGERSIISPPSPLQTPKLPQPNIKPFQDFVKEFSQNIANALQSVIPKQKNVYVYQETKQEYIKRMQRDKKLFPTCPDSSFIVTKCSTCDRKEICDVLREKERERIKRMIDSYPQLPPWL